MTYFRDSGLNSRDQQSGRKPPMLEPVCQSISPLFSSPQRFPFIPADLLLCQLSCEYVLIDKFTIFGSATESIKALDKLSYSFIHSTCTYLWNAVLNTTVHHTMSLLSEIDYTHDSGRPQLHARGVTRGLIWSRVSFFIMTQKPIKPAVNVAQ